MRLTFLFSVYSMAQASKAIIPKDAGGPFGQRIGVSVGGSLNWALRVGAYVTGRLSPSDWLRYSIVVMNCKSLITLLNFSPFEKINVQGTTALPLLGILSQLRRPSSSVGCR